MRKRRKENAASIDYAYMKGDKINMDDNEDDQLEEEEKEKRRLDRGMPILIMKDRR